MKIKLFNKEIDITYKECFDVIGKIILAVCVIKLMGYYVAHVNDEEIAKMKAEIPPVVLMNSEETLPEKMVMISRAKGRFLGRCQIDEIATGEEIVRHYKNEFEKNGWKYIGRFYCKEVYHKSTEDDWYYFFENEGDYYLYVCFSPSDFYYMKKTRLVFFMSVKKDDDDRQYCKIEEE